MIDPVTIFQRTHSGREEIHRKSHGLTQSERLVLIMVDGVSTYQQIRAKLPVLSDERFDRALYKLQLKELVLEVFMPVEGQAADELDRVIIDNFLQQDALDPVTIIFQDPDDVLGMMPPAPSPRSSLSPTPPIFSPESVVQPPANPEIPVLNAAAIPQRQSVCAIDDQHAHLADVLSAEVRAQQARRMAQQPRQMPLNRPAEPVFNRQDADPTGFRAVHWGWWLIVAGSFFILGFAAGRMGA